MATNDQPLRKKAKTISLEILKTRFYSGTVSTHIASEVHRVIRGVTNNSDPYESMKKRETQIAEQTIAEININPHCNMKVYINLALQGNSIDFFLDAKTIVENLNKPVMLAIDEIGEVEQSVDKAKKILYLADNAGECYFDLPLLQHLRNKAETVYVVRGSPVQNDITLKDVEVAGLKGEIGTVITTGNDFVGLDLETSSEEFRREFERADLIIAKGMGYYETITEMEGQGKVAFLLKTKCQPVADSLCVPLNSYVVKLY